MKFIIPNNIYELINSISALVVIILTIYTFYLTKRSNKIEIISKGEGCDAWKGYNCLLLLKNCTLHDISILEISVLYKDINNKYWNVALSSFKNEPMIIKPFEVKKFESKYYQKIQINEIINNINVYDVNNIFCLYIGKKTIFIPMKKMSKYECLKIYNSCKYNNALIISSTIFYKDKYVNLASNIKYIVHIDVSNGDWKSFLLNNKGMIDGSINGYNAFPEIAKMNNEIDVEKYFIKLFNISNDRIRIERINSLIND